MVFNMYILHGTLCCEFLLIKFNLDNTYQSTIFTLRYQRRENRKEKKDGFNLLRYPGFVEMILNPLFLN